MTNADADAARPAAVYWLYDAAGALLYVGMSKGPLGRMRGHFYGSPWWGDVVRQEMTWFRSEADALSAEARAIAAEHPVHNVKPGRVIPHLGGADAVITEEEARHRMRACSIREWHAKGFSAEFMIVIWGYTQAEIDRALGAAL